jgi:RecB family endonuclease NucS
MPIYDKPTKVLMYDFAKERLTPDKSFDKKEAVDWFASHYPEIRSTTVQMHVEGMAVNSGARKHHPNIRPGSGHDLFYKVAPGRFRLWKRETDPQPIYREQSGESIVVPSIESAESVDDPETDAASDEFAFERDLRNYLAKNLNLVEPGLKLFEDEEFNGIEYPVGGRFIDILAVDAKSRFVIIELKVSRGYDRTVGQLLRYMGWVKQHLASGAQVRGLIVASEITEDLKLAASLVPDVQLIEYELSLKLRPLTS